MRTIGEHNLYELDMILRSGCREVCDIAFSDTVLECEKLGGVLFARCTFHGVTFRGEQSTPIYFVDSTFSRVSLDDVRLSGAQFLRSTAADSSARKAILRHCVFTEVNISGMDMRCAVVERSSLTGSQIKASLFDYSSWRETVLNGVEFGDVESSFLQSSFENVVFVDSRTPPTLEKEATVFTQCQRIESTLEPVISEPALVPLPTEKPKAETLSPVQKASGNGRFSLIAIPSDK